MTNKPRNRMPINEQDLSVESLRAKYDSQDKIVLRLNELANDVERINAALGNKNRTDDDGKRLSVSQYWDWHNRIIRVLQLRHKEQRNLKLVKGELAARTGSKYSLMLETLRKAAALLNRFREEVESIDPDEEAMIEDINAKLASLS